MKILNLLHNHSNVNSYSLIMLNMIATVLFILKRNVDAHL